MASQLKRLADGTLNTTQRVLYKAPPGKRAIVLVLNFTCTGNPRTVGAWQGVKGNVRKFGQATPSGNGSFVIEETYVLEPGDDIQAKQDVGSDVDYIFTGIEEDV